MTYCLAIKIDQGLVFCSDSRTNAGADRVSTYSKMHRFSLNKSRQLTLLSAGNLGTTQAVIAAMNRDIKEDAEFNIVKAEYLEDIADYVGELSVQLQQKYNSGGPNAGFDATATFILGGQIKGQEPMLYMIYPEGNHITASNQFPFLQIGETKYGKPILDRIIRSDTEAETALRCALVSMDSTMRSNATVGPPIELLYVPDSNQSKKKAKYFCFEDTNEYLVNLRRGWDAKVIEAFNGLEVSGLLLSED
ncbi:MAG: peptidase [bacterium]